MSGHAKGPQHDMPKSGRRAQQALRKSKTPYIVGALAVVAVIVIGVAIARTGGPTGTPEDRFHLASSPSLGTTTLNVTIVGFESPNCPSCRIFHNGYGDGQPSTFDRLASEYFGPGKVRYVEKTFFSGEPWEDRGAAAQKCVWHDEPRLFFNLTQAFYHSQDRISDGNFESFVTQWAQGEKYDGARLLGCVKANPYLSEVQQDVRDGRAAGVHGTPTYFIFGPNGRTQTIVGPQPYNTFAQAIDHARV